MTKKQTLIITIITFLTFLAWVVFDILHTRAQVEIPPNIQEDIKPISPDFDSNAIDLL